MSASTVVDPAAAVGPLPVEVGRRYPHGYAVVDVETSGLSPGSHRVLQIAVAQLTPRGGLERSWSTLLDPGCDPGPVHVHGLTRQRLAGAPTFPAVAARVAELLEGRVLVAHNAHFDWRFLAAEGHRARRPLPTRSRLCTLALTRRLDLPLPDLKLASVAAYWGVRQRRAHDAVDDVRVVVEVLRHSLVTAARVGLALPLAGCGGPPVARPVRAPRVACPWVYPGRWRPGTLLVQGMKVAVTGETRVPREVLYERAAAAGLDVVNSVSARTSVLITNESTVATGKARAARANGVPSVTEAQFQALLVEVAPGARAAADLLASRAESCPVGGRASGAVLRAPVGPLARRRVLVLGGPHERAVDARERVAALGGLPGVNLTAGTTDVVALVGAELDNRWSRVLDLGLPVHTLDELGEPRRAPVPASPTVAPGPGYGAHAPHGAPVAAPGRGLGGEPALLARGEVIDLPEPLLPGFSVEVAWRPPNEGEQVEVDVVAFLLGADEQVVDDDGLVFFNAPEHPTGGVRLELDTAGEATAHVAVRDLPDEIEQVLLAAALPAPVTFGELGALELTVRDADGVLHARAVVDAATSEQAMLLAVVYRRRGGWRLRAIGQGYEVGLQELVERHGVQVDD